MHKRLFIFQKYVVDTKWLLVRRWIIFDVLIFDNSIFEMR